MQALTLAIGKPGIKFFTEKVTKDLTSNLKSIKPEDAEIPIPDFTATGIGFSNHYTEFKVKLSKGEMKDFNPELDDIIQEADGTFAIKLSAKNFGIKFRWDEYYKVMNCGQKGCGPNMPMKREDVKYEPRYDKLTATIKTKFEYQSASNTYDLKVIDTTVVPEGLKPNIPKESAVQMQKWGLISGGVNERTVKAATKIDFKKLLTNEVKTLLQSIPASGNLTADIKYDFGLGDDKITFPNNNGIQIGVLGRVTYKGTEYPQPKPNKVPLPTVADPEHLHVYVSDYEVDALHWAYWKSGLLNKSLKPQDLHPNEYVLKCKTYENVIGFKPYANAGYVMHADIDPQDWPRTKFQEVWIFTGTVVASLKTSLPTNTHSTLDGWVGDAYVDVADLEKTVAEAKLTQYLSKIKEASKAPGMAVKSDLKFTLTVQTGQNPLPNLVFQVKRDDVLQGLQLGVTNDQKVQTLQYKFTAAKFKADFLSTTIPKFNAKGFGETVWPVSGETKYREILEKMGKVGAPIPIMKDFKFLFSSANLSIQQEYVAIRANVQYKQ
ncbi:hypothetical protein [Saccharopolyspora sp. 5N708]|uniref:hypothetical protein n=1 Tax=Saccharopolyspora sp. 5N708 TaxID=3457424 RepID=UPI003FD58708